MAGNYDPRGLRGEGQVSEYWAKLNSWNGTALVGPGSDNQRADFESTMPVPSKFEDVTGLERNHSWEVYAYRARIAADNPQSKVAQFEQSMKQAGFFDPAAKVSVLRVTFGRA